jgi:hypothetical protein
MTVTELIDRILAAYPGASPEAMATFKPVFYARFSKREGEHLRAAFEATLAEFKPTMRQPFPVPINFENHMPSGKLDLGRDRAAKLDLDGRKRRADRLFTDWLAGQGTRAARGNPAIRRALENVARPIADVLGWDENPEPLHLTREQMVLACQRAISFERLLRYGQPPRDRNRWWEQITTIAAEWEIQISPEWWDKQTAEFLAGKEPVNPISQVRPNATAPARPLSPEQTAALKASIADKHRAEGRAAYADRLDREVRDLGYMRAGALEPVDDFGEAA